MKKYKPPCYGHTNVMFSSSWRVQQSGADTFCKRCEMVQECIDDEITFIIYIRKSLPKGKHVWTDYVKGVRGGMRMQERIPYIRKALSQ